MRKPLHSSVASSRRAASPAPVVLGVLAVGVIGIVAWRMTRTDPFEAPSDTATTESAADVVDSPATAQQSLGANPSAQDVLDRFAAAAKERSEAVTPDQVPTTGRGEGRSLHEMMASLDTSEFERMVEDGRMVVSSEARERIDAGLVIPSHWYRVINGRISIADPGPMSPAYAPIPAPLVPAVVMEGPGLPQRGIWRGKPALVDLDGDGQHEIVASLRMWEGGDKGEGLHVWTKRDGTWVEKTSGIPRVLGYGGVDTADIDGDGRPDLAFGCHNGQPRAFLANGLDENPAWTEASLGLDQMGICSDVALADFTGNGVPELACVGLFSGTGGLYVFSFDRDQRAWFLLAELLGENEFGYEVRASDIDGDGLPEVIATTSQGVRIHSWRDGAFVDMSNGLNPPIIGGSLRQALPHDFDGDGFAELLVTGLHNEQGLPLTLHKWIDDEWQSWGSNLPGTESIGDAEFVELDGDANPELFLLGKEGMLLCEIDENGVFSVVARIGGPEPLYHTQVADLDGDGLDEAVVVKNGGVVLIDLPATWARARQGSN